MADLKTELLCEVSVDLEPPQDVGNTPHGVRRIYYVKGGTLEGPKLKGEVLPGGGDWLLLRPDGAGELDVPHEGGFLRGRLGVEPRPVDVALVGVRVHGQVRDAKRRQVLEEVAALRGGDDEILERGLDDHARGTDLRPVDRDAQPRVRRAPPAGPDQNVRPAGRVQAFVQLADLRRDRRRVRGIEAVRLDVDHVG